MVDLFATNAVSGHRAHDLFADAHAAGVAHTGDLGRRSHKKHACRDLSGKLLKFSAWPDLYMAKIRVWNTKRAEEEESAMAFLLPHELLGQDFDQAGAGVHKLLGLEVPDPSWELPSQIWASLACLWLAG